MKELLQIFLRTEAVLDGTHYHYKKTRGVKRNSLLYSIDVVLFNLICVVEQNEQLEVCITKQNKEDRRYIDIKGKT